MINMRAFVTDLHSMFVVGRRTSTGEAYRYIATLPNQPESDADAATRLVHSIGDGFYGTDSFPPDALWDDVYRVLDTILDVYTEEDWASVDEHGSFGDGFEPEIPEYESDNTNHELLAWIGEHTAHIARFDDLVREDDYSYDSWPGLLSQISYAQRMWRTDVHRAVLDWLDDNVPHLPDPEQPDQAESGANSTAPLVPAGMAWYRLLVRPVVVTNEGVSHDTTTL